MLSLSIVIQNVVFKKKQKTTKTTIKNMSRVTANIQFLKDGITTRPQINFLF